MWEHTCITASMWRSEAPATVFILLDTGQWLQSSFTLGPLDASVPKGREWRDMAGPTQPAATTCHPSRYPSPSYPFSNINLLGTQGHRGTEPQREGTSALHSPAEGYVSKPIIYICKPTRCSGWLTLVHPASDSDGVSLSSQANTHSFDRQA